MTKNCVAVIPARSGSKRLPGKNLLELGGATLSELALRAALEAENISDIVYTTDYPPELVPSALHPHLVRRPIEISTDTSPSTEYLRHLLDIGRINKNQNIVILEPSCPFRSGRTVDAAIEKFYDLKCATSLVTLKAVEDSHPSRMYLFREPSANLERFDSSPSELRKQDQLPLYIRDTAVYIISPLNLIENAGLYGASPRGIVNRFHTVNIDTHFDYLISRCIFENMKEFNVEFPTN